MEKRQILLYVCDISFTRGISEHAQKKLHYECSQEPVTNWELGDVRQDSPGSINAVIAKTAADL